MVEGFPGYAVPVALLVIRFRWERGLTKVVEIDRVDETVFVGAQNVEQRFKHRGLFELSRCLGSTGNTVAGIVTGRVADLRNPHWLVNPSRFPFFVIAFRI